MITARTRRSRRTKRKNHQLFNGLLYIHDGDDDEDGDGGGGEWY